VVSCRRPDSVSVCRMHTHSHAPDPDALDLPAAAHAWLLKFGWAEVAPADFVSDCLTAAGLAATLKQLEGVCARAISLLLHRACTPPVDDALLRALHISLAAYIRRGLDPELDAQTLAHEALADIVAHMERVKHPEAFLAYCHSAIRHLRYKRHEELARDRARTVPLDALGDDGDAIPSGVDAAAEITHDIALRAVWRAVARDDSLAPRERQVLDLRARYHLTPLEAARRLRMSRGAVDSAWSKAITKLKLNRELRQLWIDSDAGEM
jgi:RNA polymerase sigma factor (sigma-70 family)